MSKWFEGDPPATAGGTDSASHGVEVSTIRGSGWVCVE